jgi:hypothetical protein
VAAVVDTSLAEIDYFLSNGLCSAGPDRGKSMFPNHHYHMYNHALTAVRTEPSELQALAYTKERKPATAVCARRSIGVHHLGCTNFASDYLRVALSSDPVFKPQRWHPCKLINIVSD